MTVVVAVEPQAGRCLLTLRAPEIAAAAQPGQFVMVAVPGSVLRRPYWVAGSGTGTIDLLVEVVGPGSAWLAGRSVGERLDVLGPLGTPFPLDRPIAIAGDACAGPLRFLAQVIAPQQGAEVVCATEPLPGATHVAVTAPMACGTGLCWGCAVPMRDGPPARACVDGPVFEARRVDWTHLATQVAAGAPKLSEAEVELGVDLGPLRLANPILAAAGTADAGLPGADRLGALVTKTVTMKPRDGRPGPRIIETAGGMLNAIGLQNPGVDAWMPPKLPVIASIAGETVAEYGEVAARLRHAIAIEANISCPNVEDRGRVFACHPVSAAAAVAAAVAATDLPVFAKLTLDVTDITEIAAAVVAAGAAGVTIGNTLLGLAIDAETGAARLGGGTGGLSGPAIKPVALRAVAQVARALPDVPIIGAGGVRSVTDVIEYVLAGAAAVAVGTASFRDPGTAAGLVAALPAWLAARGHRSVSELRGRLRW